MIPMCQQNPATLRLCSSRSGNRWDYVRMWKGTPVEDAIHHLVVRGVPVGGTSAGLAILGEFSFSAETNTIYSDEALQEPDTPSSDPGK